LKDLFQLIVLNDLYHLFDYILNVNQFQENHQNILLELLVPVMIVNKFLIMMILLQANKKNFLSQLVNHDHINHVILL